MRPALIALPFALAAGLSTLGAAVAAHVIEDRSERDVARALGLDGLEFAEVEADGLRLRLTGTAPSEAMRFRALTVAGGVVDPARVVDGLAVAPGVQIDAPRFAVELLRTSEGVSLIGLVPAGTDRAALAAALGRATGRPVTDFLETADYPVPESWAPALGYAMEVAESLERAKISVEPGRVEVTAAATSPQERRQIEARLSREAPQGVRLALAVSAPRPVISPFTLRFAIDADGARLGACSAATEAGAGAIRAAAVTAGATGKIPCRLGLGEPTPDWPEAAGHGIAAVAALGGGTVTFADADVTLVAAEGTDRAAFDGAVGAFESALPEGFSLHAVLPEPEDAVGTPAGPPAFSATLSEDGQVRLQGRVGDVRAREAARSLAQARFGAGAIAMGVRAEAEGLPPGWPVRVLAAIEALGEVEHGAVSVTPDLVDVSGVTGSKTAEADVAGLLTRRLGDGEAFRIALSYDEALDPEAALPSPEECIARITAANAARKITFAPGADRIEPDGLRTLGEIAGILGGCPPMEIEVAAYSDSQGRESMNLDLSQARAAAVIATLAGRRVPVAGLEPKGYGEADPIADNGTEEGREANRRIEFRLIGAEAGAPAAEPAR